MCGESHRVAVNFVCILLVYECRFMVACWHSGL